VNSLQRMRSWRSSSSLNLQQDRPQYLDCFGISVGVPFARSSDVRVDPEEFSHITRPILAAAIEVHRTLGPGLLESIYTPCLHYELTVRKLRFVAQRTVPIVYKGMPMEACYRVDLIVEDAVVIETKSVAAALPVHQAQLLTYMQLTGCPLGLLINFNVPRLMDGVKRLINPRAGRTEVTEETGSQQRSGATE